MSETKKEDAMTTSSSYVNGTEGVLILSLIHISEPTRPY